MMSLSQTSVDLGTSRGTPTSRESKRPRRLGHGEDRRRFLNLFSNVGALIFFVEPNDAGFPPGIITHCSGTLIHERVVLLAGHCTAPTAGGFSHSSRYLSPSVRMLWIGPTGCRCRISPTIPPSRHALHPTSRTSPSVLLCSRTKCLIVSRAPTSSGGPPERFGTDVDAISASYSYFNALIGSTRDARCAGMKPAHSATSASATAESASTAGSAPVI